MSGTFTPHTTLGGTTPQFSQGPAADGKRPALASIPQELKDLTRWVAWKTEIRNDKRTKMPKQVTGRNAKSTDDATWTDFPTVSRAYLSKPDQFDGVGIVLGDLFNGLHLCGVDLDACLDESGKIADWAQPICGELAVTYGEISPSVRGQKFYFWCTAEDAQAVRAAFGLDATAWGCKRTMGTNGQDHGPAVEVYIGPGRYFAVTGRKCWHAADTLATFDRAALLRLAKLLPAKTGGGPSDRSRSAIAFRLGVKLVREGADYDAMCKGLREHPETAQWYCEKGEPNDGRELRRIWHKTQNNLVLSPGAPYDIAHEMIRRKYTTDAIPTLRHQQGTFYHHTGTHYAELPRESVSANVYAFLDSAVTETNEGDRVPFKPNQRRVAWVMDALAATAQLPPSTKIPSWLDDASHVPASEVLSFSNGLLHLPTRRLRPHTPLFFSLNTVDYPYNPNAPEPTKWLEFLSQLWPNDQDSIDTLQEWFGLSLDADTSHQKVMLLVGPKRSGKGTIGRVLKAMLGEANVAGPTLTSLGDRFGIAPLIGKPLAIVSDARLGGRTDTALIADRLLSISGEDLVTIDRKNRDAWTGTLPTRFFIMSNELPRIGDSSGAFVGRLIMLCQTKSFYGHEDLSLTNKLLLERAGILNWGLVGYDRLRKRGHFVQPTSANDAIRRLEDLGSPIAAFVRERCTVQSGAVVHVDTLFNAWIEWCRDQNRDRPGTLQTFGRDLNAAVPGLRVARPRTGDTRVRQ